MQIKVIKLLDKFNATVDNAAEALPEWVIRDLDNERQALLLRLEYLNKVRGYPTYAELKAQARQAK